jgi:methyltransferase (TIGR00027 family)
MQNANAVGRTALVISEVRSREAMHARPLFDDPYAALFSQPEVAAATKGYEKSTPFLTHNVRLRTRWFDEKVKEAMAAGITQVLILGAGLDCRSLRFRREGVTYYEVDSQPVLDFKAERLMKAGHRPASVPVPADYTRPGLVRALVEKGLDARRPTFTIWEGNTYYLPPAVLPRVLSELRSGLHSVRIAFDYFTSAVIQERSRSPSMRIVIQTLRSFGAPWQGCIDDIAALAGQVQMRVEEHLDIAQLNAWVAPASIDLGEDERAEYAVCVLAS